MPFSESRRLDVLAQHEIAGTAPEPNFDRITLVGAKAFDTRFCTLNLVEAERLWIKSRFGIDVEQLPRSLSFCDHTIRGDDVLVVPDASVDPRFADSAIVAAAPHIRFYAGAPLIASGGFRIGTLCLLDTRGQRPFSADDALVLVNLAATAMELIEARSRERRLAELTRQISHLARHDPLTGLSNRRDLHARCEVIRQQAGPAEQLALLYLDLDAFKGVNDTLGHLAGDQLLVEVAGRLRKELREGDCVARIGGDEFVIMLLGREDVLERSRLVAARLVERMREPFAIAGQMLTVGASIGVAVEGAAATSLESLLRRADSLLYRVKTSGKGQYLIWPGDAAAPNPRVH